MAHLQDVTLAMPVEHQKFHGIMDINNDIKVVTFKNGYYVELPPDVREASNRIDAALSALKRELSLVRQWNGNLVYYSPSSRLVNPPMTTAEKEAMVEAVRKAYGDHWNINGWWENAQHGVSGFSVRITRKKRTNT
jgi:hypothetical protein